MASFRGYDNSDVIATLIMTNFHLNTTVVAIFPNACLWRRSLYSNLVLTLKTNCIKPPSYVSTAYVVVIRPSFLSDSFVKICATCEIFLGKWFTAPPDKKFPVRLWKYLSSSRLYACINTRKFQRNYIIARFKKSDLRGTSFQSLPKINRMLITRLI